ncbi:YfbK domain-containing protein [Brumimicrobium mesophilum]|uniref:YfbK domain-containing protein n=1 Tax=Brumimicrobium mesophilum TaxID=392717 RepID=UPI000D13F1A5|nr:von Willebrand factor type A domain-containing protein [Brumimicrobium mesophilum]
MKNLILLLGLGLSTLISAQDTGSLLIKCKAKSNLESIKGLAIEVFQDSLCWEGVTQPDGKVLFKNLNSGSALVTFIFENHLEEQEVYIQPKQLFQYTVLLDSSNLKLQQLSGKVSEKSINGKPNANLTREDRIQSIQNFPSANNSSLIHIEEVMIVAYKEPFISKDGGAYSRVILRQDISQMPVRSANRVASTVGGVNLNESNGELSFRGSRENATHYYVDGVKIQGSPNLPNSYIGSVKVYKGSIPANYGDVTGGIISVESKPIEMDKFLMHTSPPVVYAETVDYSDFDIPETEIMNYDEFLPIYENDFLSPLNHPNATFGLDVDQAAWEYLKYSVKSGRKIQRDAVKLEEMINAFQYKDVTVSEDELFNVELSRSECSWNNANELVTVHLKAKDFPVNEIRKPHNFVFLLDVSGSMSSQNRLPLIVNGLKSFVKDLHPNDRISIVTYSGYSGVVLKSTSCENKEVILKALAKLSSGGSTNGIGGIKEAYRQAESNFDPSYNNRIILGTDGDFNVGINSPGDLENYISEKRGQGIYLTALGVGMGNYKNSTLETLAKRGDGNHFYIQSLADMKNVLNNAGNMINIARDVKLNVEFNPRLVSNYRLIGYENRLLKPKDFNDDTKDGGELGYGHSVTAVFEVERGKASSLENQFVKQKSKLGSSQLAYVKLRYKPFEDSASVQRDFEILENHQMEDYELLNLVISLGLELRDSAFKGDLTKDVLLDQVKKFSATTEKELELKNLILQLLDRE